VLALDTPVSGLIVSLQEDVVVLVSNRH